MDSITISTSTLTSLSKTIAKLLHFRSRSHRRLRHSPELCSGQDGKTNNLKPSSKITVENPKPNGETENQKEAMLLDSLVVNLFMSISAIKASYVQFQLAQSPYDPEAIQSVDLAIIADLKHISELKHAFFRNRAGPLPPPPPLTAQLTEYDNLVKTYQITTKKLELEIQLKDTEIASLQSQLIESDRKNHPLEPDLDHFLAAVSDTIGSIRCFVELLMGEMESAGWDLAAAAESIQLDVKNKPVHDRAFAFESFVCQKLFSNFHCRDFGISCLEGWKQSQFLDEFIQLKTVKSRQCFVTQKGGKSTGFEFFCRAKYLELVHPRMEAAFFGDLNQRGVVSSGSGVPESDFFEGFTEMARRVWLLHCLFFSFGREMEGSIFQVKRGERFSEVYMESVTEEDGGSSGGGGRMPMVGFTVVPGFRIGSTVIPCKVYLSG